MSGEPGVQVEATGETVGEAKWAALRDLEQLVPGLDRETVRFEVLSEGERGLLGVGYTPARVARTRPSPRARARTASGAELPTTRASSSAASRPRSAPT